MPLYEAADPPPKGLRPLWKPKVLDTLKVVLHQVPFACTILQTTTYKPHRSSGTIIKQNRLGMGTGCLKFAKRIPNPLGAVKKIRVRDSRPCGSLPVTLRLEDF